MPLGNSAAINQSIRKTALQHERATAAAAHRNSRRNSHTQGGRQSWRENVLSQEREDAIRLLTSDPRLQDAQATTAVQTLAACEFDLLTFHDVQHLLKILGNEDYIEFEMLRSLLMVVLDPPLTGEEVQAVWNLLEKRPDGNASAEELYTSLSSGLGKQKLLDLHRGTHARKSFQDASTTLVDRDLLKYWIAWRSNRDDAFRTLPFAVSYLVVFVLIVMCHLQIAERELQEQALENWVTGWVTESNWGGPYLTEHVTSVDYFYKWLQDSGMPCLFSDSRKNDDGYPFVHMASSSLLIADAKLVKVREGNEEEAWLLNSLTGKMTVAQHENRSDVYQLAAQARLTELKNADFFHYENEEMRLDWCTYNRRTRMFCLNSVMVGFRSSGFIVPSMTSISVIIEPYRRDRLVYCIFVWILVGFFIVLILIPTWDETKEVLIAMKGGCKGFINYWGFWNAVDWGTISMGIGLTGLWISCCYQMQATSIQSLIDDNFNLYTEVMTLTPGQIEEIEDDLKLVATLFFILQIVMAVNVITILLKLFKAFQSNARLSVVTDTMMVAAVDIVHFLIVFMVIFMGFAMMAHVLFGNDLKEFESLGTSFMTSFNVLMGEFGWYVDFQNSLVSFGSGMPRAALTVWYMTYQICVLLCLLNMLLAVILERYAQVSGDLEGSDEAPTLWVQVGRYFERRKATKGFISLRELQASLEMTGNRQVHPEWSVTIDSLIEAFPNMKREQALWLMKYLEKEARSRKHTDTMNEVGDKLSEVEEFVENIAEELHIVQMTALSCSRKVDELEEKAEKRQISDGHPSNEGISAKVESIIDSFGEQLQAQSTATDELQAMLQELSATTEQLTLKAQKAKDVVPEEKMKDGMRKSRQPRTLPPCCATGPDLSSYSGPATVPQYRAP